ncbi:hypothetical protein Vretimale_13630 [Volvox reticuliferus]|uniref:Uncharacterized protein n=1 Tax=Volvox reticuliferus TaxID=1737510 RepID=A0A8J4BYC3_9CHLO|nr:hypothetical protein Vretifemale_475 [Volvox reticuliferus]GIM09865.1 hypothetical protein Vretimale_13630 [Volvox reticuliferus]
MMWSVSRPPLCSLACRTCRKNSEGYHSLPLCLRFSPSLFPVVSPVFFPSVSPQIGFPRHSPPSLLPSFSPVVYPVLSPSFPSIVIPVIIPVVILRHFPPSLFSLLFSPIVLSRSFPPSLFQQQHSEEEDEEDDDELVGGERSNAGKVVAKRVVRGHQLDGGACVGPQVTAAVQGMTQRRRTTLLRGRRQVGTPPSTSSSDMAPSSGVSNGTGSSGGHAHQPVLRSSRRGTRGALLPVTARTKQAVCGKQGTISRRPRGSRGGR